MSDLRTAAQQALKSLRGYRREIGCEQPCDAERALEAVLAESANSTKPVEESEPVAWCDIEEDGVIHGLRYWSEPGRREHALYTHPPRREWRGLTEEETNLVCKKARDDAEAGWPHGPSYVERVICGIDAELKERNA